MDKDKIIKNLEDVICELKKDEISADKTVTNIKFLPDGVIFRNKGRVVKTVSELGSDSFDDLTFTDEVSFNWTDNSDELVNARQLKRVFILMSKKGYEIFSAPYTSAYDGLRWVKKK